MSRTARRRLAASALLLVAACADFGGANPGGDFGATPGGVKDLRLARELIANGQVPPAEALLVEGMFAEHDLGLAGSSCTLPLCLRAAAGVAPDLDGEPHGWLQIGMSSAVDPSRWMHPSTTYLMTVDVSGSMGWEQRGEDYATPGALSRLLLHQLADQLRPQDRIAIVTYGSEVRVPLELTAGDQRDAAHAVIDDLTTAGSTNMEAGLERAYAIGRAAVDAGATSQVRIVLFTDEQPNVGATAPTAFQQMVADGADDGVEMTVVALGLGIGAEMLQAMAHLRGANAFSLTDRGDIDDFMADEFPLFTTPIAYDLALDVAASAGVTLETGYGFPAGPGAEPKLEVSTVFLSKRRGAVLVSLAGDDQALAALGADVHLAYALTDGQRRTETLRAARDGAALDDRGQWFAQASAAKTTALAILTSAMHDAAVVYGGNHDAAAQLLRDAHDRFAADAAALGDPDLEPEVALVAELLRLVESGAPQGSLYGP